MGYFFVGMAYLFHTLLLDIIIAINIFAANNLMVRYYNRPFNSYQKSNKYIVGGMIIFDGLVILLLYHLELLVDSAVICLAELSIIGVGALTVWLVLLTVETWFKYIC
jgi:hypothetical protein